MDVSAILIAIILVATIWGALLIVFDYPVTADKRKRWKELRKKIPSPLCTKHTKNFLKPGELVLISEREDCMICLKEGRRYVRN